MRISVIIAAILLDILPGGRAFLDQVTPRDSILVADRLEYGVVVEDVTERTRIAMPELEGFSNDTLAVVGGWKYESLDSSRVRASIAIAPFHEGLYELPALPVLRMTPAGTDSLLYEGVTMEVKALPIDTATFVVHGIKGVIRPKATLLQKFAAFNRAEPWFKWVLSAVIFLALAAIVLLIVVRRIRRKALLDRPAEPAYLVALRQLDRYRGQEYWKPEKQKAYYSGITDALKTYIDDRFGVDAPEMTTAELFAALDKEQVLDKAVLKELRGLFETADFVKFAKMTASDDDNAAALPLAVRFVTTTYQTELEEERNTDVL